ncbi:unnamed protein product [Rotaria magnacalcarata]|uniref:Uncharacterized protein n=1 Tax=Rotaria magnacalcarata TaxID=392030 RepID=A0A820QD16_9BILA|nr:unnamed protein product [Rotaria magnacalcarata]
MGVFDIKDTPIESLENAVNPLVSLLPDIRKHVASAKKECKNPPPDGLTLDESASIMLYSMEWKPRDKCLYVVLNDALRSEDGGKIKPWINEPLCLTRRRVKSRLDENFRVQINVDGFNPEIIQTKIEGKKLIVQVKYEDRRVDGDFNYREMRKGYDLPEHPGMLSSNGVVKKNPMERILLSVYKFWLYKSEQLTFT